MEATLLRTPLYARHVALGARMVPFAGYEMPVQYEGVIPEHKAVRTDAGAFDVSHMGEIHVDGPTAQTFLQSVLSNDIDKLSDGEAQYTLLTNDTGGIVDDLIAYRLGSRAVLSRRQRVESRAGLRLAEGARAAWLRGARRLRRLRPRRRPGTARARAARVCPTRPAFTHAMGELDGIEVMVARTGYTGEKGVELCCAEDETEALWDAILARGVMPCGLGARDTLRLEVCYPLHGNDITPETDAISAGLGWACALDTEFTGVAVLRRIKDEGPARKLVPFVMEERAIPRQGMPIEGGGEVTSGTHSPMLDQGIGMGYVPLAAATPDSELVIDVRGKARRARVVKKPIYRKES